MKKIILAFAAFFALQIAFAEMYMDSFDCGGKDLKITFIKHGTLMLNFNGTIVHVDPVLMFGTDYSKLPKADIIIVTHEHSDHYDEAAIRKIIKDETQIVTNQNVSNMMGGKFKNVSVMKNGDSISIDAIQLDAKPAYNTTPSRKKFHPKGRDNGFVLTLGSKRVYISGDTEDIPELAELQDIDIAFLSANQPYTMTVAQCVNAAKMFRPKILYPYHYNDTDVSKIVSGLAGSGIDVRIREMQ